jgi:hypothetical protein
MATKTTPMTGTVTVLVMTPTTTKHTKKSLPSPDTEYYQGRAML